MNLMQRDSQVRVRLAFVAGTGLLFLGLGLCSLVGCGSWSSEAIDDASATRGPPKVLRVGTATVESRPLSAKAVFTGNLLPRRRTMIVAEVSGIVKELANIGPAIEIDVDGKHYSEQLGILPGQEVRSGDVLVQLDRTLLQLDVAVAEAKLAKADADLAALKAWDRPETIDRLKALLAEAQAREQLAAAEHARASRLASQAAASQTELERAAMELASSRAAVASQQAALRQSEAGPTAEEIAVQQALVQQADAELRQKQQLLDKSTIYAPYDGVITEVNVEQGDHVSSASGPLFELLDLRYLVAEVGVPESHLGDIQLQDRADVLMAGSVEPVPGLVVGMNDKVDPESRSYRVRVAIDNAGGRFKAGQFVQVVLSLGGRSQATLVPTTAITFQEGQPGVFVVENERARRRLVTVGMSDDISSEILSGLVAGEVVVVDDPALLSDGMRVDAASLPADAGADGT